MTEAYAHLDEIVSVLMDISYIAENKPSKTTTYDQNDGEVEEDDENNNAECSTDCRKQSVKPHKKGKVVRSLTQCLGQLVNGIKTLDLNIEGSKISKGRKRTR